jgi:hypothetical protein
LENVGSANGVVQVNIFTWLIFGILGVVVLGFFTGLFN